MTQPNRKPMPDTGPLPDGTTWEQQLLFDPPPKVQRPRPARPSKQADASLRERNDAERRRRIEELIADGYCVARDGQAGGCGWRFAHSPNCRL